MQSGWEWKHQNETNVFVICPFFVSSPILIFLFYQNQSLFLFNIKMLPSISCIPQKKCSCSTAHRASSPFAVMAHGFGIFLWRSCSILLKHFDSFCLLPESWKSLLQLSSFDCLSTDSGTTKNFRNNNGTRCVMLHSLRLSLSRLPVDRDRVKIILNRVHRIYLKSHCTALRQDFIRKRWSNSMDSLFFCPAGDYTTVSQLRVLSRLLMSFLRHINHTELD